MKTKIEITTRIVLGILLFVFGMNKIIPFLPSPQMDTSIMEAFGALLSLKFILPTVAFIEVVAGISLLTNRFVSVALLALLPVSYGMVAFHIAIDPAGIAPAALVALLNIALLIMKRGTYKAVLVMNSH